MSTGKAVLLTERDAAPGLSALCVTKDNKLKSDGKPTLQKPLTQNVLRQNIPPSLRFLVTQGFVDRKPLDGTWGKSSWKP